MHRMQTGGNLMLRSGIRFGLLLGLWGILACSPGADPPAVAAGDGRAGDGWTKHVVHAGLYNFTAVGGDFTGDGLPDVVISAGRATRLYVAPGWNEVILDDNPRHGAIHSEVMDVDADGDLDYIGARYDPGLLFWLENPGANATNSKWTWHLIDDQIHGIHGVLVGDVDRDGRPDLLANSDLPKPPYPNSLAWYRVPKDPRAAERWHRHVFAQGDAPGLSHYLGLGDVNGDGRPDAATGAKGGPMAEPGTGDWFAWWEAPADPTGVWTKHLLSDEQPGATNIHPADVNGDGKTDFIASRGHGRGVLWFEAPKWTAHEIDAELEGPHCLVVVDIDGDGDADAATCAKDDRLAVWYENDGKGSFTRHVVGTDQAAYDIRALDMDLDGDLDLLIAGQGSQNVVWYEQPGSKQRAK